MCQCPGGIRLPGAGLTARAQGHLTFAAVAAAAVAVDQFVKWLVITLVPLYDRVIVIPGFFNVVHYQNPGGAFGLFAQKNSLLLTTAFIVVTIAALGIILYLYLKTPSDQPWLAFGLSLVFGGAAGNLIDRLRFGQVIDFLDVYIGSWHWPAFNIADSAITIGMIIFGWYVLFKKMSD